MHVVVRKSNSTSGLSTTAVVSLVKKGASAIMTDDVAAYRALGVPILYVPDVHQATLDIGRYARQAYKGQVIGVTGSAGKTTTVHMLAQVLNDFGGASETQSSANLPVASHGIWPRCRSLPATGSQRWQ